MEGLLEGVLPYVRQYIVAIMLCIGGYVALEYRIVGIEKSIEYKFTLIEKKLDNIHTYELEKVNSDRSGIEMNIRDLSKDLEKLRVYVFYHDRRLTEIKKDFQYMGIKSYVPSGDDIKAEGQISSDMTKDDFARFKEETQALLPR